MARIANPRYRNVPLEGQAQGEGHTSEPGNSLENRTQVESYYNFDGTDGSPNVNDENTNKAAQIGAHEDGHVGGLLHPKDTKDPDLKKAIENDPNNLMHISGGGTNVLPAQRTELIKNVKQK